jgi:glutamyl-tRNA synthetase/glutamyl-Q tRNA(Asp) synthetase
VDVIRPDLASAAALFRRAPITRFAPSPTGYLHLGHVVNAIYVWGVTRALGGRVLLRIEDHDRIRSRPAFEASILQDLEWLGFEPDQGLVPVYRQSDHDRRYRRALEQLRITEQVYACMCSRKEISGERYPGTCRGRGIDETAGRGVRVALDPSPERFQDLLLGSIEQVPAEQCGDLLVKDRDGHWTYQFAATVDDLLQQVDLVIRGEDLLTSTGRQIKLARMLGREMPPYFLHHPLIVKEDGAKLSKAGGDTGIRELRRAGLRPDEVIGRAAAAVGLTASVRPTAAADVPDLIRGVGV